MTTPPLPSSLAGRLSRIRADAECHAWIALRTEQELALAAARARPGQPLAGLTFGVKDNVDVAGLPTTAGCPLFAYQPSVSNPVVEALEANGAICVGKTNMDQFATGLVGTRSPYGIVPNPFHREFISGGSSSGSAVAVALGHVDFALGTDTAGSGRVPAALNGLVGLKPTRGRLSTRGVVPACRSLDCLSVFTRTAALARQILRLATFFDPEDPWSRHVPCPLPTRPPPWRIGIARPEALDWRGDDSARQAYQAALDRWQALGHEVSAISFEPFAEAGSLLYQGPWVAERFHAVGAFLQSHAQADGVDPTVAQIILGAAKRDAASVFAGLERLRELRRAVEPVWRRVDFLCLPTVPTCPRIEAVQREPVAENSGLGTYTNFVNLLDLCAVTIPYGRLASGIPTGPTLIAPAFHDEFLLAAAGAFLGEAWPSDETRAEAPQLLAVCGAHLRGQPLHADLLALGARFVETTRTAPSYRLHTLPTDPPKPGLLRVPDGGAAIEVEIYAISSPSLGKLIASVPEPLAIGTVRLADGRAVHGFLCEAAAAQGTPDITAHGGWRSWLLHRVS